MAPHRLSLGVLLTAVMAVSNLIQFALGVLGPLLVTDLSLSRADLGILTAGYFLFATAGSVLLGRRVDRAGARRSIAALLILGAVGSVVLAAAGTYGWLLVGLALGGVVAALSNPATNLALAGVPGRLGVLVGAKQSGVQGGALLAGVALPPVALLWGWPAGFLACAALFLVCLAGLPVLPGRRATVDPTPPVTTPTAAPADRPSVGVLPLAAYALCMGAGMATVNTYLALYGHERIGMSAQVAGWLLATVGAVAVLARIAWSVLADRSPAATRGWLLPVIAAGSVVAVGLLAAAPLGGAGLLWAAAVALGLSGAAWNSVVMLAVIRDLPADRTAVASGRVQAAFFLGLAVSPPIFGVLVDRFDSYPLGWAVSGVCFAVAGSLAVAAHRRATGGARRPRAPGSPPTDGSPG